MEYPLYISDTEKSKILNEEYDKNTYQDNLDLIDCDLDRPVNKKPKLGESLYYQQSSENVKKLIDDWVAEYNKWYKITLGNDRIETKEIVSTSNMWSEYSNDVCNQFYTDNNKYLSQNHIYQSTSYPSQFIPNSVQQSVQIIPSQQSNNNQRAKQSRVLMGYWGPLLRYGTYGVYTIYNSNVCFKRNIQSQRGLKTNEKYRLQLKHPLDPPLRIRMPRQAMICTLQAKMQGHLHDVRKLERDPVLHMNINYTSALEQVTSKCGTCPKYLFAKVCNLPATERQYFTNLDPMHSSPDSFPSMDGSIRIDIRSTNDFYACELFIGDIIISQGFALWKRRAREICARTAFRVLERECYLVGSTRFWYGTDYMTACITDNPSIVPLLPPFLTDPTEPLYKKDERINESDRNENFDVLNPKSIHDFWLYATTLKSIDHIKSIDPQMLLYLSAEFSQMNLSFEVDSSWDESFSCTIMLDKSPAIRVDGLGSLEQACQAAALVLVDKLVDTQPIVTLTEAYHKQYTDLELNLDAKDNEFLVHGLMWTQSDSSIDFEDLSDFITPETFLSLDKLNKISSKTGITNQIDLEYFLNIYAQSSLVSPLMLHKKSLVKELWEIVPHKVKKCGLVVMTKTVGGDEGEGEGDAFLICKQVPHTQLKAKLLRDKEFRTFRLLNEGNLPSEYLSNLTRFIGYDNIDDRINPDAADDHDGDLHWHSGNDFLSEKSSLYSDIIRDVQRDSIPGLDC